MSPGVLRLTQLCIAGTTRAWHLYLICALLGGAFLLSVYAGSRTGDLTLAMALAALFNGVIWLTGTVGMLATVRELRGLRAPHVYRKAGMVLGLAALLTIIMPAALLVMSGGTASGLGTIRHIFMALACGATTGMLVATLPLPLVGAAGILLPLALRAFVVPGAQLAHTALWQSAWLMEAIMLPALLIVAWRCRALIRSETTVGLVWWSLAQIRVMFTAVEQAPNVAYRMFPAWMVPSWRTRADASLWTRISTLLGPPFAPGNLRQLLATLVVVGGIGAVGVWFLVVQQMPGRVQGLFAAIITSQIPLVFLIVLFSTARTFAGRMRMIHRPHSADLAELALLPGLGIGKTPLTNYCLALFGRPLRMIAVVTVVMGGALAAVVRFTPWNPVLLVLIVAGFTVMEVARYLAVGRPIFQNIFLEALASVPVVMSIGALAFFSSRTPFIGVRTYDAISHVVMPAIAVIVCLAAIQVVRWAYATAARLPHPFLDAEERRVLATT